MSRLYVLSVHRLTTLPPTPGEPLAEVDCQKKPKRSCWELLKTCWGRVQLWWSISALVSWLLAADNVFSNRLGLLAANTVLFQNGSGLLAANTLLFQNRSGLLAVNANIVFSHRSGLLAANIMFFMKIRTSRCNHCFRRDRVFPLQTLCFLEYTSSPSEGCIAWEKTRAPPSRLEKRSRASAEMHLWSSFLAFVFCFCVVEEKPPYASPCCARHADKSVKMEENVRAHRDCASFIFCLVPIVFQIPTGAVAPVENC